jgi:hypothetical protein
MQKMSRSEQADYIARQAQQRDEFSRQLAEKSANATLSFGKPAKRTLPRLQPGQATASTAPLPEC